MTLMQPKKIFLFSKCRSVVQDWHWADTRDKRNKKDDNPKFHPHSQKGGSTPRLLSPLKWHRNLQKVSKYVIKALTVIGSKWFFLNFLTVLCPRRLSGCGRKLHAVKRSRQLVRFREKKLSVSSCACVEFHDPLDCPTDGTAWVMHCWKFSEQGRRKSAIHSLCGWLIVFCCCCYFHQQISR